MDSTGPDRIRAIGEAWQRTVQAVKQAATKPPADLNGQAAPTPREGR